MNMKTMTRSKQAPSTPRITQVERSAMSDQQMLNAAVQLIVERGTEKMTLKDVGEMAGYSRGLAGYRFGSKSGLLIFVLKSIGEEWLQELKAVTEGKTGLDALCAATDAHYRFCVDAPEHVRAFYILWFESIGPKAELKDVINAIHERRYRDVSDWINKGIEHGKIDASVDAEKIAGQFCASIIGIVYQWLARSDDLQQVKELYDDLKLAMTILLSSEYSMGKQNEPQVR